MSSIDSSNNIPTGPTTTADYTPTNKEELSTFLQDLHEHLADDNQSNYTPRASTTVEDDNTAKTMEYTARYPFNPEDFMSLPGAQFRHKVVTLTIKELESAKSYRDGKFAMGDATLSPKGMIVWDVLCRARAGEPREPANWALEYLSDAEEIMRKKEEEQLKRDEAYKAKRKKLTERAERADALKKYLAEQAGLDSENGSDAGTSLLSAHNEDMSDSTVDDG